MKKIDVIKVKRIDNDLITAELITINDDLADFYKHIECSTIDIVLRRFNKVYFDVICDDEALLRDNIPLPTSWYQNDKRGTKEGLFGTLLLCHHDDNGNLTSATFDDLLEVHHSFRSVLTNMTDRITLLFHDLGEQYE